MSSPVLLVGDIGGTNARFALAEPDGSGYRRAATLNCADFNTPEVAIEHYLESVSAGVPDIICLAVAGPITDGAVKLTNNHWHLSTRSLQATFRTSAVRLLNDFEAIAYSLPVIRGKEILQVGEVPEFDFDEADFCVCVLGPGTGLGAAGLLRRDGVEYGLVTEAGHIGFAPESDVQLELLRVLRQRYKRVSNERLVSGLGIENVYWGLGEVRATPVVPMAAADIFGNAAQGEDLAVEAVALFFEILGQIAGNLVLAMGAFEGAYVAGGIAQRHGDLLAGSRFRSGFENKGRHRQLLEQVPTLLIRHAEPGLAGASGVARTMVTSSVDVE